MSRRTIAAVLAVASLSATPALADDPAVQNIPGAPLSVYVGSQGQFQAFRTGEPSGLFFEPSTQFGDAGFFLAFPAAQPASLSGRVYGFQGKAGLFRATFDAHQFTPISLSTTSGDGTAASPWQVTSVYGVEPSPLVTVEETASYVNGANEFLLRWKVTNDTNAAIPYKAFAAGDFYFEGDDDGTGIFTAAAPRFVGGTNVDTGRSGGFVETTEGSPAWSHYEATRYPDIWTDFIGEAATASTPTLTDHVLGDPDDNAGAVEWDDSIDTPLPAGGSRTYAVIVRSAVPAALQFNQTNAGAPQHTPISFVATAKDTSGTPFAGKSLRYAITGANPGGGAVTLDPSGNGTIIDPGANAGPDTVIAFLDLNGDGVREEQEPQASALATFVDKIPPSCAVKVSGDRPGGGGAGKPLVISVNCDSQATVTTRSTFSFQPKRKKHHKKPRKVTIKLPAASTTVGPGEVLPVDIKVPKATAKKYSGAKLTATVTVTAVDTAGNRSTKTASRTVTLRAYKVKKKKHHKG